MTNEYEILLGDAYHTYDFLDKMEELAREELLKRGCKSEAIRYTTKPHPELREQYFLIGTSPSDNREGGDT